MKNLLVFIVFYLPPILFSAILPFICNYSVHFVVQSHMQSHTQRLHLTFSWFVCSSPYSIPISTSKIPFTYWLLIISCILVTHNLSDIATLNLTTTLMGTISETGLCYFHSFLVLLKGENPNLLYAWFLWVEEWPGLHMLGNQFTAHLGYFLPPPQNGQGQLLFVVLTTFYELRKSSLQVLCISNDLNSSTCYMTIKLKFQSGYTWLWYNSK